MPSAVVSLITALIEGEAPTDVFIILAVVVLNTVLGVVQESKAEKAIDALNIAEKGFKKQKVLLEATSNHEEILRIELAYGHVREFIESDQMGDAMASCGEIKKLIRHLPSNFKLKAENIL